MNSALRGDSRKTFSILHGTSGSLSKRFSGGKNYV